MQRTAEQSSTFRVRGAVIVVVGVVLIWLIVTRSLTAYLADVQPDIVLKLRQDHPTALLNVAERVVEQKAALDSPPAARVGGGARDGTTSARVSVSGQAAPPRLDEPGERSADLARSVELLQRALALDPLNARSMRLLAEAFEQQQRPKQARDAMAAAARLSLHDTPSLMAMLRLSWQEVRYEDVAYWADAILRTQPELAASVVPVLAAMVERPEAERFVGRLLADNPPWRQSFFALLPQSVTDARTPLRLLLALQTTDKPATGAELKSFLDFLISKQLYEFSYYSWLQFLSPEELNRIGLLYNANFELEPTGVPFDWHIAAGYGVDVEVIRNPSTGAHRGLYLEFQNGRVQLNPITELVLLPPGEYRFTGQWQGRLIGSRGLAWRLRCADTGKVLGESPMLMGSAPDWKRFQFSFRVPEAGCKAQDVSLFLDARSASETLVQGAVWISDLVLARADRVPTEVRE